MKAQPEPIVSGMYFLPSAPFECWNRIPEAVVTSVNRIADWSEASGSGNRS